LLDCQHKLLYLFKIELVGVKALKEWAVEPELYMLNACGELNKGVLPKRLPKL